MSDLTRIFDESLRSLLDDEAGGSIDLSVTYLWPHPAQDFEHSSLFLGLTPHFRCVAPLLGLITQFPLSAIEPSLESIDVAFLRTLGGSAYQIRPIEVGGIDQFATRPQQPLTCVLSTPVVLPETMRWIREQPGPVLHLSEQPVPGAICLRRVRRDHFTDYFNRAIRWAEPFLTERQRDALTVTVLHARSAKTGRIDFARWAPKIETAMLPNDLALSSVRRSRSVHLPVELSRQEISSTIIKSFDAVTEQRRNAVRSRLGLPETACTLSAVLWVPGTYAAFKNRSDLWRKSDRIEGAAANRLLKEVLYSGAYPPNNPSIPAISVQMQAMISERRQEVSTIAAAVGVLAASYCVGAIHARPESNRLWSDIRQLARSARTPAALGSNKLRRMGVRLSQAMNEALGTEVLERITALPGHVKLLCDVPFEWANINGLPLGLACELSRIPTVPGNAFIYLAFDRAGRVIDVDELCNVLVVRSFRRGSPISRILEDELSRRCRETRMQVSFVDVMSEDELVQVLNEFRGALLIFDGHGDTDGTDGVARIVIGEERIHAWRLRGKVRMPPLVWLSACDTHPIDGSNPSVAQGFLVSGARSVMATMLPVDAVHAATTVGRLVSTLHDYLVTKPTGDCWGVRWSTIISSVLRVAYAEDLVVACTQDLPDHDKVTARYEMNSYSKSLINAGDERWFERLLQAIADKVHRDIEEIRRISKNEMSWSEVPRYVQLGNPECLLVRNSAPKTRLLSNQLHPTTDG